MRELLRRFFVKKTVRNRKKTQGDVICRNSCIFIKAVRLIGTDFFKVLKVRRNQNDSLKFPSGSKHTLFFGKLNEFGKKGILQKSRTIADTKQKVPGSGHTYVDSSGFL